MSEWASVLAVFWALWAVDGVRLLPRAAFTWVGGVRRGRARTTFGRWSWPGVLPTSWRATFSDVPLAISPTGVSNRPVGSTGRPADAPPTARAWRWDEIHEVGVAKGMLFVNGERFCADTGHVSGPQLLALARLDPIAREKRIRALLRDWWRPAQLRRRATVVKVRTANLAVLNGISLALLMPLTVYVLGNFAADLPARWSDALARMVPWLLLYLLVMHVTAVVLGWRAVRRIRVFGVDRRGSALFSALLLPPQAMRLRMVVGEGFFPPQHPLAGAIAWGDRAECERLAFPVLADLRWPIDDKLDSPLAREVSAWFRTTLEATLLTHLRTAGIEIARLFEPPPRDGKASCSYCPRCRDQFGPGAVTCPHGVPLTPLA